MSTNPTAVIGKTLVVLTITLLLLNGASYVALRYRAGVDIYDHEAYERFRQSTFIDNGKASIPHPFFGKEELSGEKYDSPLSTEPMFVRVDNSGRSDDVKVLILGGSVASHLSSFPTIEAYGIFADTLRNRFGTGKFSIYNAAFGGGKQPQQYFKLVYLDLLGFKPDIVINYDGFNEIALPLAENATIGNPAIFPRSFSAHVDASSNTLRACAKWNNYLESLDSGIPFVELVSLVYSNHCRAAIERVSPAWWSQWLVKEDTAGLATRSVDIWRESSNRIEDFSRSHGIEYIHVLQPNQYLPNSKILSETEKDEFLNYPLYGEPIRLYYGSLSGAGITTKHFHDQRYLFKDNAETLYEDKCCHFGRRGLEYIAADIVNVFHDVFAGSLTKKGLSAEEQDRQ